MSYASSAWWRALREADSSVYAKAFNEVLVIGGISITPLIIAAFGTFYLQDVISSPSTRLLPDILWGTSKNGAVGVKLDVSRGFPDSGQA